MLPDKSLINSHHWKVDYVQEKYQVLVIPTELVVELTL